MRANTRTLLSLYEWYQIIGYHPWYAAQIGLNVPARSVGQCDDVMFQYGWQNADHLGREDIATAIQEAEELIARALGYYPAPQYTVNEKQQYPARYNQRQFGNMLTARGQYRAVQVNHGNIQSIGIESLTVGDAAQAVTYSDEDGDGIDDTFTITGTIPAGTDTSEIALFFVSTDYAGLDRSECEIRPLDVSISGTTVTITGSRVLMVLPAVQLALEPRKVDALLATDFATTADIYLRTTDTTQTGTLIWENLPAGVYFNWYGESCTPPCQVEITTACIGTRDQETGWVYPIPATYDTDTAQFNAICPPQRRQPDRMTINYLSGAPRDSRGRMDARLAKAVAYLAAALLPSATCGCERADQKLHELRNIPMDKNGNLHTTPNVLDRTAELFGINYRGAVEAAKIITPMAHMRAL